MKRITSIPLLFILLYGCAPIKKVEMPNTGNPPMIEYSKDFETNCKKDDCYDKLFKEVFNICSTAKLGVDSKSSGLIQITGNSPYTLNGGLAGKHTEERKFTYVMTITISDNKTKIVINNLNIQRRKIEYFYYHKNSRVAIRNLNPAYSEINNTVNEIITRLGKTVEK